MRLIEILMMFGKGDNFSQVDVAKHFNKNGMFVVSQ